PSAAARPSPPRPFRAPPVTEMSVSAPHPRALPCQGRPMPHRSAETATYPGEMAKVEIDMSEDLLAHVDACASRAGETRDEFMRRIITAEIDRCLARLRKELQDLRTQMG